ncbi:hypothetical protein T10_13482 [Trichinella papuae]|uniref:Uncharacterized protein n=1 Tax=Trichinella papuae TaxID=268474 RepID=A0A0V1MKI8_9BILA|nr:hypothetical protein T10_13482 [Trichinella papuae]
MGYFSIQLRNVDNICAVKIFMAASKLSRNADNNVLRFVVEENIRICKTPPPPPPQSKKIQT